MLPLIVSFYTKDWEYPRHARRLALECHALELDHCIEERPSAGGYLENTCLKPAFIRDMLHEHKRPVLWIDVDGSIYKKPTFFVNLFADIAAKRMPPNRRRVWHVGTMWFNYNERVLEFMDRWVDASGSLSDESALEEIWREFPDLFIADIPPAYFQIEINMQMPRSDVIIMHRISTGQSKMQQQERFVGDKR